MEMDKTLVVLQAPTHMLDMVVEANQEKDQSTREIITKECSAMDNKYNNNSKFNSQVWISTLELDSHIECHYMVKLYLQKMLKILSKYYIK